MAGFVMTAAGPVAPHELGITLTHEHVLIDLGAYFEPDPDPAIAEELRGPLRLDNLGWAARSLVTSADDLVIDDDALAITELGLFAARGGRTVCDVSVWGIRARDHARRVADIAAAAGLQVVLGTGVYVDRFHSAEIRAMDREQLARLFVHELTTGIGGSDCRAGLIGEIGLGTPPTGHERVVLDAAADAQLATGAPIVLHQTDPTYRVAREALNTLATRGVPCDRVVVGHSALCRDAEALREVLARGAFVAFDTIGIAAPVGPHDLPTDGRYVAWVLELAGEGFAGQLLLSQDVAHKRSLHAYGGRGYDHILATLIPRLRAAGGGDELVQRLLVDNASRILTIDREVP